mgnify:CR=1 FL=1
MKGIKTSICLLMMCALLSTLFTNIAKAETTNPYEAISVSEDDINLLAALDGQKAVVEVVFNRILDSDFKNSVYDVIYEKRQFSTASKLKGTTPNKENYEAVNYVIENGPTILSTNYVYFSVGKSNGHNFTKLGGHWFSTK